MANPSLSHSATGKPASRMRDRIMMIGLLVLFCAGMYGLARNTGWNETIAQLNKLSIPQIATLLALSLANYGLRGLRWHLLSQKQGLGLSLSTNILHFFGGFAMTITPGRVGELIRLRWMANMTQWPVERLTPLPLADRAFDLAAMGGVLALGLAMSPVAVVGAVPVAVLALCTAVVLTRPTLLIRLIEALWVDLVT